MARKTIEVSFLKDKINDFLFHSADHQKDERTYASVLLESVLHETGNYQGFMYLGEGRMKESKNGTTVGINDADTYTDKFDGTDATRVHYF